MNSDMLNQREVYRMNNTHKTISDHLNALNIDVTNYEALVRCYILAQLNIQYSSGLEYKDGVNAGGFGRICVKYRLLPTAPVKIRNKALNHKHIEANLGHPIHRVTQVLIADRALGALAAEDVKQKY